MRTILLLLLCLLSLAAPARTVQLSLADLSTTPDVPAALRAGLTATLQAAWDQLGLAWQAGELVWQMAERDVPLREGCARAATLDRWQGTARLTRETVLALDFTRLNAPITLTLDAPLTLAATGRVEQRFGLDAFGHCRVYARDGFDLRLDGRATLRLQVTVDPGLEVTAEVLHVTPRFTVRAALRDVDYRLDVDLPALDSLVERALRERIDAALGPEGMDQVARRLAERLRQAVQRAWGGPTLTVALPPLDAATVGRLAAGLDLPLVFPLAEATLRERRPALWRALLDGDDEALRRLFTDAALCEAGGRLALPVRAAPLYRHDGGACLATPAAAITRAGTYYADPLCRQPLAVRPQGLTEWCRASLDRERLGNGAALAGQPPAWHLSPGTRMDTALVSTAGLDQPWLTERVYKTVDTPAGRCALIMRIFQARPDRRGDRPLLALHGGGWQYRRNGALGIEVTAAHYTSRGFVLFAPFYRLAGHHDGPAACQGASGADILADVGDALDWVRAHGAEFGAAPGPVWLTGQSAGAHLAAWLAVHRPAQVARALLLYSPTDMADYLRQWQAGALGDDPPGLKALAAFLDLDDPAAVDPTAPFVRDNSLPALAAAHPAVPPLYLVHGAADELVPVRQSIRLCNALGGDPDHGPADALASRPGAPRLQTFACDGRGSRLQVVTAGRHMLDLCLLGLWCPAGDEDDQAAARRALTAGYDWLAGPTEVTALSATQATRSPGQVLAGRETTGAGGGVLGPLALLLLAALRGVPWHLTGRRRAGMAWAASTPRGDAVMPVIVEARSVPRRLVRATLAITFHGGPACPGRR